MNQTPGPCGPQDVDDVSGISAELRSAVSTWAQEKVAAQRAAAERSFNIASNLAKHAAPGRQSQSASSTAAGGQLPSGSQSQGHGNAHNGNQGMPGPSPSKKQWIAPSQPVTPQSSVNGIGPAVQQNSSYYPNSTNMISSVGTISEVEMSLLVDVLTRTHPVRGAAVVALARHLVSHRFVTAGVVTAMALAVDLLEAESDAVCETLTRLLTDGWEQGIGAAFRAARTL